MTAKEPKDALLDLAQLSKAGGSLLALVEHLQSDRLLIEGGTHRGGTTFAKVGDTVLRVSSEVERHPLVFNWAQNVVRYAPDRVSVNIAPTTLAELLDCQRELEKNGSGEARVRVAEFINFMRQETEPAEPMKIEIVNAKEVFAPAKTLVVKRDSEGKMSGATIEPIS